MGSVKYTPPSSPSPTASFYDVSDDDEDEYNTISHARSGRGVKLLYSKSKVRLQSSLSEISSTDRYIAGLRASNVFGQR